MDRLIPMKPGMHDFFDTGFQNQVDAFPLRTFRQNLGERMDPGALITLNILGEDFFHLVDFLSSELYGRYQNSAAMLELSEEEFLWELQVFVNQFIRICAETSSELIPFYRELRVRFDNEGFCIEFHQVLNQAFLDHFYHNEGQNSLPA